jgi:hypothetical protein
MNIRLQTLQALTSLVLIKDKDRGGDKHPFSAQSQQKKAVKIIGGSGNRLIIFLK